MAARAIWTGAVTFGLVSAPVKLYAATESKDITFHQGHMCGMGEGSTPGAIKYKRTCDACGTEVAHQDIVKTLDTEDGTVVLTKQDMESLPLDTTKAIEVQEFVPFDQVDPILFEKVYYLAPATEAAKRAYALLCYAIASEKRAGIVKVTLRQREQTAMLHVRDGGLGPVLAITTLLWPDEVRTLDVPLLAKMPELSDQELGMASLLVQSMESEKFNPDAYTDGYRVALQAVIDSKRAGIAPVPVKAVESKATDLMAALMASIEANKAKRQKELVAA